MKRPALLFMIYAIIGILFGIYFNNSIVLHLFIVIVILSNLIIVVYYKNNFFSCFMIVSVIYFFIANNAATPKNLQINNLAKSGESVNVEATITDKLKKYDNSTLYIIKVNKITTENDTYNDKVYMYMYVDKILTIGDVINFDSVLRLPSPKRNDSDFNQEFNYKIKNISCKVYVSDINIIGHKNDLLTFYNSISCKIFDKLYKIYPEKEAGILAAMILGDKTNIDNEIYELYRLAGIVHIVAISGLHISIFACILLTLLRSVNINIWISNVIVMIFMLFYCIFTGCSVSVLRATIMMYIYISGTFLGTKYDLLSSASTACCALLFFNPYYIFDIGFQYSFTAIFAIGFTSEIINKYEIKNKYLSSFIVAFAVTIATKPITAHYFYYINILDVFVNIVAISLMEVILAFALMSIAVSFIYVGTIKLYTIPVILSLKIIENIADHSLSIPYSQITVGFVPLVIIIISFVMLLSLYAAFMVNKLYSILACLCIIIVTASFVFRYKGFEADFMYVGQGDCTIIRDEKRCYLIDAGSNTFSPTGSKILSQLKYNGISKINGIYISHMDYDHMGAVLEIANDISIENIIVSKYCEHNENYFDLISTAAENNINIIYTDNGYSEKLTYNMYIKLVFTDTSATTTNDSSAVYSISYKGKKILFTGDISTETEEKFIESDIDADILKVPHHGSKNSISKEFIDKVDPIIAVNFAGYNNIYKHPSEATVELYRDMKIPFLSTDQYGIIKVRIDENGIYYKCINTKYRSIYELIY